MATGVRCDGGSCLRIEQNLITGRGGSVSHGVFLQQSGAYVDNNEIRGGCSPGCVVAAPARVQQRNGRK